MRAATKHLLQRRHKLTLRRRCQPVTHTTAISRQPGQRPAQACKRDGFSSAPAAALAAGELSAPLTACNPCVDSPFMQARTEGNNAVAPVWSSQHYPRQSRIAATNTTWCTTATIIRRRGVPIQQPARDTWPPTMVICSADGRGGRHERVPTQVTAGHKEHRMNAHQGGWVGTKGGRPCWPGRSKGPHELQASPGGRTRVHQPLPPGTTAAKVAAVAAGPLQAD